MAKFKIMKAYTIILSLLFYTSLFAQVPLSPEGFKWRNIGPANQGGRITDIEALDKDFTKVYAAVASGGVWKSENAGTTWQPIFDKYETASIGDIALDQNNPNILWVGTGEANNRNSVSWGNGIYKSTDGGETFKNMGLESTHQIGRVIIHPEDSDNVCACAIGHLWGYSGDRGLFQTKDGGKTWQKLTNGLPNDGKTGCTDIVRDSKNPDVLYAAFYHRLREPWHFHSGGGEGGIYKSTDGGKSWKKLKKGLPKETGRIGLAIYKKNPNIVMAIVEAEKSDTLAKKGSGVYRSEDAGKTWKYVNTYNHRPFYYSNIRINPNDDQRVYVLTTRFMVSEDGGKTLKNGSEDQEVHGDFHALWHDPLNKDRYYLGADKGMSITHDHGKTFRLMDNFAIGQFYRINYDMRDPYYVYGGLQDNGMYGVASFTRDARGILNDANWKLHWGDGQYVNVNPNNWREMYTSMENGSYFKYDPLTHRITRITPTMKTVTNFKTVFPNKLEKSDLRFNWSSPMVMSPHNSSVLYAAGNYVFKSTDKGTSWTIISPDLSTNHPKKRIQGKSGGITPDNTGAETHCSVSSLSISPIREAVIWIGTDDGNIHYTKDGGRNWINVRANVPEVPEGLWVSRIEASHFEQSRAYLTFDGHRSDNFDTWVFVTHDFGKTWTKITNGIAKNETVRVIREDHNNPNLLFIGTETGIWYSINGGQNWERFMEGLPTVSIYDLKIHERENDLIAGTHGRSIWIMDDISPLQQLTMNVQKDKGHVFNQKTATIWENVSRGGQRGHFLYAGENPKTIKNTTTKPRAGFQNLAAISYYIGKNAQNVTLEVSDFRGKNKRTISLPNEEGIHRYYWDMEFDAEPLTETQKAYVNDVFEEILRQFNFGSIRRLYQKFKTAKTAAEQRKAVAPLTGGYLNFPIDEEYLMPKATIGSYKIALIVDGERFENTLDIREDPLGK